MRQHSPSAMSSAMSSTPVGRRSVLAAAAGAGAVAALAAAVPSAQAAPGRPLARPVALTVTARPAAEAERLRLAQALRGSEFQPTGLHVPAGTPLSLTVRPHDGLLPTLWIGAWDYYGEITEPRAHPLTAGANTVTDPHGGPVYLTLTGHGERADVLIRSGALPMPVFTLGRTTEADFQRQLDTLTASPWAELHGPDTIMTLTRDGALQYRGEDHAALLRLIGTIIDSHARISGLDGSAPGARRKAGPDHVTQVSNVPPGVGAYAPPGDNGVPPPKHDP
ncbi:M60 family metallopeptidase, partial [Streptomyces sp. NPDC059814]|uniref:M60 family metallopeptidase n=1 Tax=Streptomyces sp. NPDC059814 TaxID=3346959 RepID=UPI003667028F